MTTTSLDQTAVRGTANDLPARPDVDGLAPDDLKRAFRNHPAGVAVITADSGDGPVGLTATSVFSVCASPPLLAFSLAPGSYSAQALLKAETVVIHLLGAEQRATAQLFATKGADRFADKSTWARRPTGEPYLVDAPVWIRARVCERLEMQVGGSVVVACHALEAHIAQGDAYAPLVYHDRAWHRINEQSKLPG